MCNETFERFDSIITLLKKEKLPVSDLLSSDSKVRFIIIKNSGSVDAAIGLEVFGEVGLLRSLVVDKKQRGRGYGKQLVKQLEGQAKKQSIKSLYLLTESAKSFFESLGYKTIPRTEAPKSIQNSTQFSELCPSSAVFMVKEIRH
jgi:amino-acid N-acetyltransferase